MEYLSDKLSSKGGKRDVIKNKIILYTIFSAILFTLFIIFSSLSPLAYSGPNANQFNSSGMWGSIAFILIAYAIPLMLYAIHPTSAKVIMAIFCTLGLILALVSCIVIGIFGYITGTLIALIGVVTIAIAICIINTMWFFKAFSRSTNLA